MANLYGILKHMMCVADVVGGVDSLDMGEWLGCKDRIVIRGVTFEGQPYEMTLEVAREEEQDA